MTAEPANELTAVQAAREMAVGRLTSEALVSACLERIAAREDDVRAWAFIDPALALAQARAADAERVRGGVRSPLHGIPVGIKDVIDTYDMPTEYGSPIYLGHRPAADAACVSLIRQLGGVILGKTVSTEFATGHPNKTRNPHSPLHTPGGSSSGSGAAVADCMMPLALGTQTSSSIIRPAAYCGVVGYKPTYGLINRAGLKFLSESLDTLGVLSRTVADAALLTEGLTGLSLDATPPSVALRIGVCRTPWWDKADAATQALIESSAARFAAAGAKVSSVLLEPAFDRMNEIQIAFSSYEFYRALTHERTRHPELISPSLTGRLAAGGMVTRGAYEAARADTRHCIALMARHFDACDIMLAPSTPGEAPGIEGTGEPTFGLMWTQLGLPCITVPAGKGSGGLPLGVQVIAAAGNDAGLMRAAAWVERMLAASA
ncbi:MAG: amidase [Betaproteobacteria bacterium]|nr:amidase [Betaproteobacteria bacterium]